MKVTRLDLDGTGSPMGLVTRILKVEKDIQIPVPIEELAKQLDIEKIEPLETEAFEGGLLTDENRAAGIILVNKAAHDARRQIYYRTRAGPLSHYVAQACGGRKIPVLAKRYDEMVFRTK